MKFMISLLKYHFSENSETKIIDLDDIDTNKMKLETYIPRINQQDAFDRLEKKRFRNWYSLSSYWMWKDLYYSTLYGLLYS